MLTFLGVRLTYVRLVCTSVLTQMPKTKFYKNFSKFRACTRLVQACTSLYKLVQACTSLDKCVNVQVSRHKCQKPSFLRNFPSSELVQVCKCTSVLTQMPKTKFSKEFSKFRACTRLVQACTSLYKLVQACTSLDKCVNVQVSRHKCQKPSFIRIFPSSELVQACTSLDKCVSWGTSLYKLV